MTNVGNEYDSAEKLINATNLVIGEVLECEAHPDSDHLHICKVNVRRTNTTDYMWSTKCKKRTKSNSGITRSKFARRYYNKSRKNSREKNLMECYVLWQN